jgi:hypothetical protein
MGQELSRIPLTRVTTKAVPEPPDLTRAQSLAVAALASGATITAAAEAARVSRPTLYQWLHYAPAFGNERVKLVLSHFR